MSTADDLRQFIVYTSSALTVPAFAAFMVNRSKHKASRLALKSKVDQIFVSLVGEEPTELNPHPALGLVALVDKYQSANVVRKELGDQLINEFTAHKQVVEKVAAKLDATVSKVDLLTHKVNEVAGGVTALVIDSKPNGGATSRDALNRIEGNTASLKEQ